MPEPRCHVAVVAPGERLGGQGIEARLLAAALASEGCEVSFVPLNPRFPPGLRWVRRIPYARTLVNEMLYLPSLWRLQRVDVVHVFAASSWSFVLGPVPAILAGRVLRKRVVLNYHSGRVEEHLARWGALVHPWLRLVDEIVVPSDYLHAVFARHGYDVRVVRNFVDLARFPYRARQRLQPRLLSTRNLETQYRVDNTLRAFALVREGYPDARLVVAGSGSEEPRLRRLAGLLGERGIRFTGRVDPEDIAELYAEGDVFLNSSVVDNQPLPVLEAFAAGLPVVSTPAGGIRSLVRDGETGILVPPDDPAAMAAAVAGILEEPGWPLSLARRARHEVERHSWAEVRDDWALIYPWMAA